MSKAMKKLVLASGNQGKITEISALLLPYNIEVIPQSQFDIEDIEETGTTFVENAILKAKHASEISRLPALADDSGLVVPALGGAPGIYSARYAQRLPDEPKSDAKNNEKLLTEMQNVTDRQASFICLMALCFSGTHPLPLIAQGQWYGEIALAASGNGGFGYDPLFFVPSHNATAAVLAQADKAEKNRISHRGLALQSLFSQLSEKTQ